MSTTDWLGRPEISRAEQTDGVPPGSRESADGRLWANRSIKTSNLLTFSYPAKLDLLILLQYCIGFVIFQVSSIRVAQYFEMKSLAILELSKSV